MNRQLKVTTHLRSLELTLGELRWAILRMALALRWFAWQMCRSTFALALTMGALRWIILRVRHARRMSLPSVARGGFLASASEGWYRYGESNPGSKVENLVS